MDEPLIGSEAVRAGDVTPYQLRSRFRALHQDVYVGIDAELTPLLRAEAAWLRSRRRGILAGLSASALHGAKWIDPTRPAAIFDTNRRPELGVEVWAGKLANDEVCMVRGIRVTTPARTAFDIASRYPVDEAVCAVDALAQATRLKMADVELLADRYRGRRGIRSAREAIELADPGAQSPRETWLRLVLIRAGFPRPQTQIPVYDEYGQLVACVDMGWEDIKVAVDYDGAHHRTARQFDYDIRRAEALTELGWVDVRVTSEDTPGGIIRRVKHARNRRT
jgi:hypothetical protein